VVFLLPFSIDATHSDGLGRLCNDEHKKPNAIMKKMEVAGQIHLCLFALRDIDAGEELRYNYGPDEGNMPWRKVY
jgi:SET domain-containing protein